MSYEKYLKIFMKAKTDTFSHTGENYHEYDNRI